ncbi:MAG TPA: hypothetical protein VFC93_17185 [Chloroflexota bacterium]|nr:hypothetical protein [Chloroflexota bacterium]
MPLLVGLAAFVLAGLASRIYRLRTGAWVPGWTGGISLLVIFAVFAVVGVALGSPAWFESVFVGVVGLHVGTYLQLGRTKVEGRWWQLWR